MITEIELFESPGLNPSDFCSVRMDGKSEVYKRKVEYTRRIARSHVDAAARIKTRDNLRRTTRDLRTRVAKCLRLMAEFSNIYCEL